MSALMPVCASALDAACRRRACARAGRMHLGFLDPSGTLGRRFGSSAWWSTASRPRSRSRRPRVDAWHADTPAARGATGPRAMAYVQRLREQCGRARRCACACAACCRRTPASARARSSRWRSAARSRAGTAWTCRRRTLARWLGRGLRSGIGIAGFDQGGLLVDGGPGRRRHAGAAAGAHARCPRPGASSSCWTARAGPVGRARERSAIAALPPLRAGARGRAVPPGADARAARRRERRLRAVRRRRQSRAAAARRALRAGAGRQRLDQPGRRPAAAMGARPAGDQAAVGQSSWGPTGFAIVPSAARGAAPARRRARRRRGRRRAGAAHRAPRATTAPR